MFFESVYEKYKVFPYELRLNLDYNLKSKISLNGKSFEYDDIKKFIVRKKEDDLYHFVPYFACNDLDTKNDKVVDFSSMITIGACELLGIANLYDRTVVDAFLTELFDCLEIYPEDIETWYEGMFYTMYNDEDPLWNMRSKFFVYGYEDIRQACFLMLTLKNCCPDLWVKLILQLCEFVFPFIHKFTIVSKDSICMFSMKSEHNSGLVSMSAQESEVKPIFDVSRICIPNKYKNIEYKITNSRGLGINIFTIFSSYIYRVCDETTANVFSFNVDGFDDYLDEKVLDSLGNDVVSHYVKTGELKVKTTSCGLCVGRFLAQGSYITVGEDSKMCKDSYIDDMIYADALGIDMLDGYIAGKGVGVNMHYANIDLVHNCYGNLMRMSYTLKSPYYLKQQEGLKKELREYDKKVASMQAELEGYRSGSNETVNNLRRDIELKDAKIKELEDLLAKKSSNFADIYEKYESLVTVWDEFNREDDEIELDESGEEVENIPMDSMIEVLNTFNIVCFGGFEWLHDKLSNTGLKYTRIKTTSFTNTSPPKADFILLYSGSVSHKLFFLMKRMYSDMQDRVIYVSSTNVDRAIRQCYNFVEEWLKQ